MREVIFVEIIANHQTKPQRGDNIKKIDIVALGERQMVFNRTPVTFYIEIFINKIYTR